MNDAANTADPYAYLMALTDAEGYAVPAETDGSFSPPAHRVTFTAADHRAIDLAD